MLDITRRPSNPILSTAGSFLGYVRLFWGKVCYLGGREAAAYFTGQDRVKNKTAANSTPRVLQGLSMTPSFPLSPKPGSTSPEGLPTPGAVAFGFYANNCLTGNALQPDLVCPAAGAPLPALSRPGLPRTLTLRPQCFLRLWIPEGGRETRKLGPWPSACPGVAVACRWRFAPQQPAARVNGLVV